jgi:peptidoglycan/xylan/chitin deacetylase (PgdA/CDA1 family)
VNVPSPARLAFLAWAAAACAVLLRAALGHGFGLRELAVVGGLPALGTVGVFFPWLEMHVPSLWRGPLGKKQVALTFDDGPHPETTRRVLATLAATRHRATFFVLGDKARRHPDIVREIHAAGHALGVHGDVHDRLHSFRWPSRIAAELARAQAAVEAACGVRPRWFRPPLGHTSPLTAVGVRRAGVRVVGWSARGYDGLGGQRDDAVIARLRASLKDGAIVLLHDAAERDDFVPAGVSALPEILALLDERGLTSVTLPVWAEAHDKSLNRSGFRPELPSAGADPASRHGSRS